MQIGKDLIDFYEQSGEQRKSPIFRFAPEAAQTQRSLFLPYTESIETVFQGAKALLGYSRMQFDLNGPGGAVRRWIEREPPAAMPAFVEETNPDLEPYMFCTSVPMVEPMGVVRPNRTQDVSNYQWWRFATIWDTLGYDILADHEVLAQAGPLSTAPVRPDEGDCLRRGREFTRWITRQVDPGSHAQSLRSFGRFAGYEGKGEAPIPEGYTHTVSRIVITYTHHVVPGYDAIPFKTIQKTLGTTNNATFDDVPPGCLMLSDAKWREYKDPFGQRVMDVTYTMIFRPNIDPVTGINWGWHGVLRVVETVPGQPRLRVWPVSADGSVPDAASGVPGKPLKEYKDFSALFRPDQGPV